MVSSNSGKRRGWRIALAALAFGTVAAVGITAAPASAEGWHRGPEHREWVRHDWDRHGWRGWGWHGRGWYGYGWYDPPPVVYAPPPVYYPGSLNVYIPLR